jgi:pimeloyl-ACP methyl ester carboxylesterase
VLHRRRAPRGLLQTLDGYLQPLNSDDWDRGFLLMSRQLGQVPGPPPDLVALRQPALVLQGAQDTTTPPSLAAALVERLQQRPGGWSACCSPPPPPASLLPRSTP